MAGSQALNGFGFIGLKCVPRVVCKGYDTIIDLCVLSLYDEGSRPKDDMIGTGI